MQSEQFTPSDIDQPLRVDATEFSDHDQLDFHPEKQLHDIDLIRQSIVQATQTERVPTHEELLRRDAFKYTRGVRSNRRIYDRDHIDLQNEERPTQDMFGLAA